MYLLRRYFNYISLKLADDIEVLLQQEGYDNPLTDEELLELTE